MNAIIAVASGQPDAFTGLNCKCLPEKRRIAVHILRALAQNSRMKIVCLLIAQERSVNELLALTSLYQATVSQHLARLRQEGLVRARRDGRAIFYSVADLRLKPIIHAVLGIRVADSIGR